MESFQPQPQPAHEEQGRRFVVLEKPHKNPTDKAPSKKFEERELQRMPGTVEIKGNVQYKEHLEKIRRKILQNERIKIAMITAIKEKRVVAPQNSDTISLYQVSKFASVENYFVKNCLNLKRADIEKIVNDFNIEFQKYLNEHRAELRFNITLENKDLLVPIGIISVIEFIKSRQELPLAKNQRREFFFDNDLDMRMGIDLIEIVYQENDDILIVEEMNLAQVKSKGDINKEEIIAKHLFWVKERIVNRREFNERFFTPEEEYIQEIKQVDNLFLFGLERILQGENFDVDENFFIKALGLQNLTHEQKAGIFKKYEKYIESIIKSYEGLVDSSNPTQVKYLEEFKEIVKKYAVAVPMVAEIKKISSVLAHGAQIIDPDKPIVYSDFKDKIIKYS